MIARIASLSLLIGLIALVQADAAAAECGWGTTIQYVQGAAQTNTVKDCPAGTVDTSGVAITVADLPPTSLGLDAVCVATALSLGQDIFEFCDEPPDDEPPQVTPGIAAAAFVQVPIPASSLQVQPPNGRTLVNFDTNFFTETAPFDTTVTLLGQRVDLHIVPTRFGWQFGDGVALTTEDPGAPYPQLDVTHNYLTKGSVAPSVDTTWTATYRVNGGPWVDVPGSVTIPGPPVQLQVLTATPTLVGYAG